MDTSIQEILLEANAEGASDVHITVGIPPKFRINGKLVSVEHYGKVLPADTRRMADEITNDHQKAMLEKHPDINALFVISAGAYGAARAVLASRREDITMIVFDTIPTTIEMMKKGIIQAAIYQHPHQQGQRAMLIVFDYLVNGIEPECDKYIMRNEIRILQNAEG